MTQVSAFRPVESAPRARGRRHPLAFVLHRLIGRLRAGRLSARLPSGETIEACGAAPGPEAALDIEDWRALRRLLLRGDIGFAEGYVAGDWTSPDLVALIRLAAANAPHLGPVIGGGRAHRLLNRVLHRLRGNSRRGSRRNIMRHYDLGNDFFRLWLDESMLYSSGLWDEETATLEQAQADKLARIAEWLDLGGGEEILEIGCGWGALAEAAAREAGARVTAVTLSSEQLGFARDRIARAGLDGRVELRLQDYRDIVDPPFDAIVSIEMFEAVGREYWPGFFAALREHLKPGGRACLQTITIRDDLFERYLRSTDFIQQYVFPGGLLPSRGAFRAAAGAAGLRIVDEFAFGADYAETLRRWRRRFLAEERPLRGLGFDTRFLRTWEFYLAYCEAAFATGSTDVVQFTLQRT